MKRTAELCYRAAAAFVQLLVAMRLIVEIWDGLLWNNINPIEIGLCAFLAVVLFENTFHNVKTFINVPR